MKKKYKLKTKIGQRVSKVTINIVSPEHKHKQCSLYPEGVFVKDYKIAYQSSRKTAINSTWITTFDRQEEGTRKDTSFNNYIESPCISIKTRETIFSNGIFGTLYTLGDSRKAIIKLTKAMQERVNKEYGFMFNINVGDIVEGYLDSGNF